MSAADVSGERCRPPPELWPSAALSKEAGSSQMRVSEASPLYGRDPLLRSLVPRLTGLALDERSRTAREHQGDLPVVLVTGYHGMGRSAVLAAVAARSPARVAL